MDSLFKRFCFVDYLLIKARFYLSFLTVRPIRWFFWKMIAKGSFGIRLKPEKHEFFGCWQLPNVHWVILYKTVFKFFCWLYYEAWRPFCDWTGGWRQSYPPIARFIHWIGASTAGYAVSGSRCYHCNSEEGCQTHICDEYENNPFLISRVKTWSQATMDGTDYRFSCTTKCPKCGYKSTYEDGSL